MEFKPFFLAVFLSFILVAPAVNAQRADAVRDSIPAVLPPDSILPAESASKKEGLALLRDSIKSEKKFPNIDELFQSAPDRETETGKDSLLQVAEESEIAVEEDTLVKKEEEFIPRFYDYIAELCHEALNDSAIQRALESSRNLPLNEEDYTAYFANPFFIDLVYLGIPLDIKWKLPTNFTGLLYQSEPVPLADINDMKLPLVENRQSLCDLRKSARDEISQSRIDLYASIFTKLPSPNRNKSRLITTKPLQEVKFVEENVTARMSRRLQIEKPVAGPWQKKANAMVQFSQNYVSDNWHQGGSGNMAVLGILTGQLNYNNKKNIQWENSGEWRAGFMNVDDTTALRMFNTNDDVLKINSKLGIKAGGNWFYSGNLDFSTQFFDNYKSLTSKELKTTFLTPVRLTIGVGMDYKYKTIASIMFAPIAYKMVYANDTVKNTDPDAKKINTNPNSFGIETGK
ncbi:MAG: DUF3078 domain-containing protein, partial [Prevotellaceae bacterium]|nr:DUF3078 domain-containing protein [Prevotellaceae bacterium]